jgi:AtzE family amidohydrolase
MTDASRDACATAAMVRSRQITAREATEQALDRIAARDNQFNCFTTLIAERALDQAASIDAAIGAGHDPGPLAGVPFAVKNLFDIEGITTLAGSRIYADKPPADADAAAVAALKRAGAVLIGALNMDEYAYGFTTENTHYGPTRNPRDPQRMAGGSSGGSAAAVAAGLVPLSLGSDGNGSIRVPSALCGVFGLKPTFGRVSRVGVAQFAPSFDHVGPLARSVADIATAFDALQGPDPRDSACTTRSAVPTLPQLTAGVKDLRIAVAGGYFASGAEPEALGAVTTVAAALGATARVHLPEPERARAAAWVITAGEGANVHLADLKRRPNDFDPLTRDRFLAGALVPSAWLIQAQRFRSWYRARVEELFRDVDIVLAPATPCVAPPIGQDVMTIGGVSVSTRPTLGIFTQPLSFIGLPIMMVPVQRPGQLPLGVQVVASPFNEALILRVAAALEAMGVVAAPVA